MAGLGKLLVAGVGMLAGARAVVEGLGGISEALNTLERDKSTGKASVFQVGEEIEARIAKIREMVDKGKKDPVIRSLAMGIINRKCGTSWCIPEKAWRYEVEAIFDWVRKNVRYTRDVAAVDTFQSPRRTLKTRGGDCDCITILLAGLLQSVGYPVRFHVIQTKGSSGWSHILLKVGLPPHAPKSWLPLDGSLAKPAGWYPPKDMVVRTRDFEAAA